MFDVDRSRAVGARLGSGKDRVRSGAACDDEGVRILVIEDDARLAELVARRLRAAGHVAEVRTDGPSGLERALGGDLDLAIVDVMLPGLDGMSLTRSLREQHIDTPVLMLTARDAIGDRDDGLRSGADDYLVKPFAFAELLARLRALARRGDGERPTVVEVGDLRLDPGTREVWRGGTQLRLTTKEFALLEVFMRRAGQVLSRYDLLENAWDFAYENRSNVVDVYMRRLRGKIDEPFGRHSLETIRGAGYRLRDDGG
jgi:two-component system OmpR family response regulator